MVTINTDVAADSHSVQTSSKFIRKVVTKWDWFCLIIPLVSISPLLYLQANYLWAKQHLQFFPLAFAAAAWFLYQEGNSQKGVSKSRRIASTVIATLGVLVCFAALGSFSSWLAHLAVIVLTFAWTLGKFGNLSVVRVLGICGLLAVTLPPPFSWDRLVVQGLQSLSTIVCNRLMDATQLIHVQSGNVIDIASKSLFVEEACSGVDSQYALMAVAGTLLLVGNANLYVSLVTVVTVPLWAILGNLLRIYSIAVGLELLGLDLSNGTYHTILGLCTFAFAAWAHWSSVQFLNYVSLRYFESPEIIVLDSRTSISLKHDLPAKRFDIPGIAMIFPCLMFVMTPPAFLGVLAFQKRAGLPPLLDVRAKEILPSNSALPSSFGQSRLVGFSTQDRSRDGFDGQHSRIWEYLSEDSKQTASLDLPFRGWHPLWICYELAGWKNLGTTSLETSPDGTELDWQYFETALQNTDGSWATLQFALFCEDGIPYSNTSENLISPNNERTARFLVPLISEFIKEIQAPPEPVTFQFQLLSRTSESATEEQIAKFRSLFLESRERIREKSIPAFQRLMDGT